MKNSIKMFGALIIGLIMVSSCKKDTDPADRDFFVGTYQGTITYRNDTKTIQDEDGKVTVTKINDTYSFIFGSGIPDITGVKFQGGGNSYASIGEGLTGISINESTLRIAVTNSSGTWSADCKR